MYTKLDKKLGLEQESPNPPVKAAAVPEAPAVPKGHHQTFQGLCLLSLQVLHQQSMLLTQMTMLCVEGDSQKMVMQLMPMWSSDSWMLSILIICECNVKKSTLVYLITSVCH